MNWRANVTMRMRGESFYSSRLFSIGEPITSTAERSSKSMQLDLDDEENLALLNLLTDAIETDRYPLSPRVQVLRRILAKFGPIGPRPPRPARPTTTEERDTRRRSPRARQPRE